MTVKIIIERRFKEIPKAEDVLMINELRTKAMHQNGYISGETLIEMGDNKNMVVLSTWSNVDDWDKWYNSRDRREIEEKMSSILEKPTSTRTFLLGADCLREILAKAVHDADAGE